jgi:hypothetical protein
MPHKRSFLQNEYLCVGHYGGSPNRVPSEELTTQLLRPPIVAKSIKEK